MKKNIFRFIILVLFPLAINAQVSTATYKVSLEKAINEPSFGDVWKVQTVEDYSFLKNVPDIACDLYAINSFKLNQYIAKDSFPNQMYLFVGVSETKKEKYVVVDANNNHDFSDDKLYTFSLPDKPLTKEEKIARAVGIEITLDAGKNNFANIGIEPFNSYGYRYSSTQDERLEVLIVFTEYMKNTTEIAGIPVEIEAWKSPNLFQRELNDKSLFTICYNDKAGAAIYKSFQLGDTIHVNDIQLQLSKIEHPSIYFRSIALLADSSAVGSFVPTIYAKDRISHKDILINNLIKDKYVVIDFWGSWCGPCIGSLPKLKEFYKKIEGREDVLFVGVAVENKNALGKLEKIITSEGIKWNNLWAADSGSDKNSASITKKLNILSYPTYLVIDKDSRIVYKGNSLKKADEIISSFLKLIDK